MPDISQIELGGTTYDLKDKGAARVAIVSKTFDKVWSYNGTTSAAKEKTAAAAGTNDGSTDSRDYYIYLGKIYLDCIDRKSPSTTYLNPWHIKFKVVADTDNAADGSAIYEWEYYGAGTTITYSNFNNRYNWTPIYYTFINRLKAAGLNNTTNLPLLFGINFYSTSSTYSNRSYYRRTIKVDVVECDGCHFEFLDDWQSVRNYHASNTSWLTTTNYYGYIHSNGSVYDMSNFDAVNNGLRESGDENSTAYWYHYSPLKAGGIGIKGYSIISQVADGSWASFTTSAGVCSASTIKSFNSTDSFLIDSPILYYITNTTYAAGSYAAINAWYTHYAFDTRYVSNYYGTSSSDNPTKSFGFDSGTAAKYHNAWIKVIPNFTNGTYKIDSLLLNDTDRAAKGAGYYLYIGSNHSSTSEYYRISAMSNPQMYYVDANGNRTSAITIKYVEQKIGDLATVATSGSYNDLSNKPTIPSAVTETTVSGWGFTKNTGTYSKPSGGIPKSDLATTVQTSLGLADSALQPSSTLDATKLSGTIPSGCYTNTTYESKAAASGGTAVSLVTTGEKYNWNNKQNSITSTNKLPYSHISGTPTIPTVGAGQITLVINGQTAGQFSVNQSSNQTIDLGSTCFRGDTSYITMADGSQKLLQDIQVGDVVKSRNVETHEDCEAVVLYVAATGKESEYETYFFDNGASVEISGPEHFVVDIDEEQHTISGFVGWSERVCQKLKSDIEKGKSWYSVITPTGKTKLLKTDKYMLKEPTMHYNLFVSNGSFYVNGLLHANRAVAINSMIKGYYSNLITDKISGICDEMSAIYSVRDESLPDDNYGNSECVQLMNTLKEAENLITQKKAYLNNTDYKAIKYAEGILTEAEWIPVKTMRSVARTIINEQEVIVRNTRAELSTKYPNVMPQNWKDVMYTWRRVMTVANNHLQDFKDWAQLINNPAQ